MRYIILLILLLSITSITGCDKDDTIILGGPRGDESEPGPVEIECQRYLDNYNTNQDMSCILIGSKVGYTKEECPESMSLGGCSICEINCE